MSPRHRRQRGQGMVEFALVATLLITVVLGIMDFAYLFAGRVATTNATRIGARYGATHSSAWTNSANPGVSTIEGQLRTTAVPTNLINDDTHIQIQYFIPNVAGGTQCGHYSATSNAFVSDNGYTQTQCITPGNLILVKATYNYMFITPLIKAVYTSPTINSQAVELIEA